MSSKHDRIAHAMLQFHLFRIPHPSLGDIADEIDTLRSLGRQSRELWEANGKRGARTPHKYLAIIGPSHTGKSTAIRHYLENMVQPEDAEMRPVVHVTLSSKATIKQLATDILEEYKADNSTVGNASSLYVPASRTVETAQTDVLVLDGIHHLQGKDGETATDVTETIKRYLIRGSSPLILVGTDDAKPLLVGNPQFKNRTFTPIFLRPLDVKDPKQWKTFVQHCGGFDLKLVEHGIFPEFSGLDERDVPACVYDVSGGVIGTASNLFQAAAIKAIKEEATRIGRGHLEAAVDEWARPLEVIDYNPFRDGVADLKVKKA